MSIKTTVLTLALLSASAMVAAAPYSAQTRTQYLSDCTQIFEQIPALAASSKEYCSCTLNQLEKRLTEKEFTEGGDAMAKTPASALAQKFNRASDEATEVCQKEVLKL
ncbi:MAG: hypothetical protein Q4G42_08345 [Neisseria sp.]|nr:hypothetical protein [Neisseria sp.]